MSGHDQRVFVSYRRSDCQPQANGLHDGLRHRLQSASIFMDIDSIPPGVDFEDHIRREIEICDVVLVLIGDNWLEPRPGSSVRRIDEDEDFVRLEIESALSSSRVRVVPVLVEGAQMPSSSELPESIRRLARINAIELSDRRWTSDLERLAGLIEEMAREPAPPTRNMRLSDVQPDVVAAAVASMPPTFRTKDLSENVQVLQEHQSVRELLNYHTMMGRYLASNHAVLGLQPPQPAVDDRGAIWHKAPVLPTAPFTSIASTPAPYGPQPPRAQAMTPVPQAPTMGRQPRRSWLMVALPIMTCGLASFVPPIWAARQRWHDLTFRRRMILTAGALGALTLGGFVMVGASPVDAEGTPTGALSSIGAVMLMAAMAGGVVVALLFRGPSTHLPGTAEELARRAQREQYRDLIRRDPSLAHGIQVGRPDLQRDYSDGGLLDLNALSADALSRYGSIPSDEARRIVVTRERLGRFTSLEEVVAYSDLSELTVTRLRETAIFL